MSSASNTDLSSAVPGRGRDLVQPYPGSGRSIRRCHGSPYPGSGVAYGPSDKGGARMPDGRNVGSRVCLAAGAILLVLGVLAGYLNHVLLDGPTFAAKVDAVRRTAP